MMAVTKIIEAIREADRACDETDKEIAQMRATITALREALAELADIVEGVYEGVAGCKIDSFTTQPARQTLATTEPEAQPLYPFCTHCTWDRGKLVKQDPACPIHGTKGKADEN